MTPHEEVLDLMARREGQTTEFKTSLSEERESIRPLCAMANSKGGMVLVGVSRVGDKVRYRCRPQHHREPRERHQACDRPTTSAQGLPSGRQRQDDPGAG